MWQYNRRISLTPHAQTVVFAGHQVKIDANGQVISEVGPELAQIFEASGAWKLTPSTEPEVITKAVVADVSLEGVECDILPETKTRSKAASRSRRKSPKTSKAKD
jgi:hypothetical protein